ncbi:MAG: NusG domain II-containing protein [Peptoniphilaceae bacterium]|nr:NusG domain II-containing protein [Peptoniphilaceae bacterium]MDY6018583.1 NusG domain II-containing protein [Anaerococcus sp.]
MKIKKMDIVIIFVLFFTSLAMVVATHSMQSQADGEYLVIELDGKEYAKYDLNEDRTVEIESKNGGKNTIEIKDKKARMVFANCTDLICTRMPAIGEKGQTIVCLPHRLYLEVDSNKEADIDQVVK